MNTPVLISREPVLNRNRLITAHRLTVRTPECGDPVGYAAEALRALEDVWPPDRTVFVSLNGLTPAPPLHFWEMPANVTFEVPLNVISNPETVEMMQNLQASNIPMCLDGWDGKSTFPEGVSFRYCLLPGNAPLANLPGLPIAKGLKNIQEFDTCIRRGFDGACGWFFLRGNPASKKLNPSHAMVIRLMNFVRNNADIRDIEDILRHDVALSYKLLRYINSPAFGLSVEIQSFRHAVTILGYEKLQRWLSLLLVTSSDDKNAAALMQASLIRARYMENIARDFLPKSDLDNVFITGAFSLLDVLLGCSMEMVMEKLTLPDNVRDALVTRTGPYAPFLNLAISGEHAEYDEYAAQADALQVTAMMANRAQLSAIGFADDLEGV